MKSRKSIQYEFRGFFSSVFRASCEIVNTRIVKKVFCLMTVSDFGHRQESRIDRRYRKLLVLLGSPKIVSLQSKVRLDYGQSDSLTRRLVSHPTL